MSCTIFSSVKVRGEIFEIELKTTDPEAAYVAVGFSTDSRMGDDLVTECVKDRGQVAVFTSYTSGPPNYGTSRAGVPQNDARLLDGQLQNGQIYCKVQRTPRTTANGRTFDLANEKYHLLVAAGKSLKGLCVFFSIVNVSGLSKSTMDVLPRTRKSSSQIKRPITSISKINTNPF